MNQTNPGKTIGPDEISHSGPQRESRSLALLTVILIAVVLIFYFLDPATSRGFWTCPFHRITGWYCPGCGGQRALHELLHGHFIAALRLNPLAILLFIPAAIYAYTAYAFRVLGIMRLPAIKIRNGALIALLAAIILFGILHNVWGPLR